MNKVSIGLIALAILLFTGCTNQEQPSKQLTNEKSQVQYKKYTPKSLTDNDLILELTNEFVKNYLDIPKPTYPQKPKKPYVKPPNNLVKGKFEKTTTFQKRVQKEKVKREKYILALETKYKKDVLAYNKEVKELTDNYNKKLTKLKNNIENVKLKSLKKSYGIVYGKPILVKKDYDADNEMFYGTIKSSRGSYKKDIAIKIPIDIAQKFYEDSDNITPNLIFDYTDGKIYLKDIKLKYKKKQYLAMLTDTDYKSSEIQVAIKTRDLNLKNADMLSSNISFEKSDFNIGNIDYGKSKVAKLNSKDLEELNKQRLAKLNESNENLQNLLEKAKKVKKNPKAYAIVFGIEDYLLESNVSYSQNSAMMFMQYANKLLGVPDDHIWAFIGDRKTGAGFIKSQWDDFLSLVEDDATVYFYYSGHGVPGSDGKAYILPSDTNAETASNDKTFKLENIYKNLTDTKAKKVVAFVDSCFSGKDEKGSLLFEGVAPVLKVKKTQFDKNKMTILTAGGSKHFSNQYKEKQQRLFSYYLMKGLAQNKTDIKDLYKYVKVNVANKSRKLGSAYKQIPQIQGNQTGKVR